MIGTGPGDAAALRAEVERARADLAGTAEALAAKADVPARARQSVVRATDRVRSQVGMVAGRAGQVIGYTGAHVVAGAAGVRDSLRTALPRHVRSNGPVAAPSVGAARPSLPVMLVAPAAGLLMRLVATVVGTGE